jgi:hypothetical protein
MLNGECRMYDIEMYDIEMYDVECMMLAISYE